MSFLLLIITFNTAFVGNHGLVVSKVSNIFAELSSDLFLTSLLNSEICIQGHFKAINPTKTKNHENHDYIKRNEH